MSFLVTRKSVALSPSRVRWRATILCHWNSVIGVILFGFIVLVAIFAPFITRAVPYIQDMLSIMLPPSWRRTFGTDDNGRDIFTRVIYNSRILLIVVVFGVGIAVAIGMPLGMSLAWQDSA